jgi:hypothetical protein
MMVGIFFSSRETNSSSNSAGVLPIVTLAGAMSMAL